MVKNTLVLSVLVVSIALPFKAAGVGPELAVAHHTVGDSWATDGFLRDYDDPRTVDYFSLTLGGTVKGTLREHVIDQLQWLANSGVSTISTRIWLGTPPENPELDPSMRPLGQTSLVAFPMSVQNLTNIQQYARDVAAIRSIDGRHLFLELALLWLGCANYHVEATPGQFGFFDGDGNGVNDCIPQDWQQFDANATGTAHDLLQTVAVVDRPDGKKVVRLVYLTGEILERKHNEYRFLEDVLPDFARSSMATGVPGSVYFQAHLDESRIFVPEGDPEAGVLEDLIDEVVKVNSLLTPLGYALPSLDFSFYPDRQNHSYDEIVARTFDDIEARFSPNQPVRLAETVYPLDERERLLFGQALLKEGAGRNLLRQVTLWTTPCGGRAAPGQPQAANCAFVAEPRINVALPLDLLDFLTPAVGDVDLFMPGDTPLPAVGIDVPPRSPHLLDILSQGPSQAVVDLDVSGADRWVGLTHFFSLPDDVLVTAAVIRAIVRGETNNVKNDVILFDQAGPPFIAIRDLIGREPADSEILPITITLGRTPVRLGPFAAPGGSLPPGPDEFRNLLPLVFEDSHDPGQIDLVYADDLTVDYSTLTITYVHRSARVGELTGDDRINSFDVRLVLNARNTTAYGADDPRDLDRDGVITVADARLVVLRCDVARCLF